MTDPAPTWGNPSLPARWQGGTFEGHLAPLHEDWYAETRTEPEWVALATTWAPLEDQVEGDPPGQVGFDLASAGPGPGSGPRRLQTLRGVVRRVSATGSGVLLEEQPAEWLNVSRYRPIDLAPYGAGDVVEVVVEQGANGKKYLHGLRRVEEPGA